MGQGSRRSAGGRCGALRCADLLAAVLARRRVRHAQIRADHPDRGLSVAELLDGLGGELVEAADKKVLTKTIARYGRVDFLCIDELGYMELDRHGAELLFQVLTEREEKNSVAIASNESFSGWTRTFTDPRLCAATVDRLTFDGNIIETVPDFYRLAQTRARAEA
ncbi:ATP-binding protein [Nonomuraea sp. NPDC048881]|uniref:ATP-binding protein n=1 Tax=Nonomuraea sp. NPDC048881 TaxID=3155030 RepID=UPI0033CFED30